MPEQDYPEHQNLKAVKEKSNTIGQFIEWLKTEKHIVFAKRAKDFTGDPELQKLIPPT